MTDLRKWQRKYRLLIEGTDGKVHEIADNPHLLTLNLSIVRNNLASANTGNLRIYNLNQSTRDAIFKDHYTVSDFRTIKLQAGYSTEPVLPTIFKGNINYCLSYREEGAVDFVTEINAFDYGAAISNSYSKWNKGPGASKNDIIDQLISDMSTQGGVSRGKVSTFTGTYPRAFIAMGNTWDIMQRETARHCFIDNGAVNCLLDDDCISGDISEISSETGLLGSPRREENYIRAEILFEPRLNVGQLVSINSRTQKMFNGTYKVTGIAHQGIISDAVSGKCKTILHILLGSFQTI